MAQFFPSMVQCEIQTVKGVCTYYGTFGGGRVHAGSYTSRVNIPGTSKYHLSHDSLEMRVLFLSFAWLCASLRVRVSLLDS